MVVVEVAIVILVVLVVDAVFVCCCRFVVQDVGIVQLLLLFVPNSLNI